MSGTVAYLHLRSRNRVVALPIGGPEAVRDAVRDARAAGRPMFSVVDVRGERLLFAVEKFDRIEPAHDPVRCDPTGSAQVSQ